MTNENLKFREYHGDIKFNYSEPTRRGVRYEVSGTVPSRIVKRGEEAILKYASHKVNEAKKEWRKEENIEDGIRKNHIPIQIKYKDGTSLEGRIVGATPRFIGVELDKPLKGQSGINFGFGSPDVFTNHHQISREGYEGACEALCWAYRDALHAPEKDLVERLNQRK